MTDRNEESSSYHIICPSCDTPNDVSHVPQGKRLKYCVYCGVNLTESSTQGSKTQNLSTHTDSQESATLIADHFLAEEPVQFTIGSYQVIKSIGRGGMGEVFLAYDTTCGRRLALKRIRDDLVTYARIQNRFLKEARITSQLTHPSIIPIYSIHSEEDQVYYTMPYVEGETLKELIRRSRRQDKKGEKIDNIGASIPALIRIFISMCQAVAYAHSKRVLHRDLKPENVIIGKFGEVLILDWGLAKMIDSEPDSTDEMSGQEIIKATTAHHMHGLTHAGKVVGTITYMAPERALGHPATFQTDIYSLGVILYQLLTLRTPFKRGTLKEFKKNMHREVLTDPMELAPYRDIPELLSRVVKKCLLSNMEFRYDTVEELLHDLESYMQGRSDWIQIADLDVNKKQDWEFQENVLLAEHMAITHRTEETEWVNMMISKESFIGNTKLQTKIKLGEKASGIGFLICVPEAGERIHLNDGFCLWLGSDINKSTKLLRANVEVVHATDIYLKRHEWVDVRIEKIDQHIHFYLNNVLQFSYIGLIPLIGTHVGLLSRDADYSIQDFKVFVASLNINVNCLAVPDAFLAQKNYDTALSEYRRIGYSFPGRYEGREAIFRAGLTLIEKAKNTPKVAEFLEAARQEFEKLHQTPGAPLEYLGKALVYQVVKDFDEEIKCFELAYRRYPRHPLLPILQEQILSRMYECSRMHRRAAYQFILLTVRHLPLESIGRHTQRLFTSLQKHWETLPFIEKRSVKSHSGELNDFAIILAFWLGAPFVLGEIIDEIVKKEKLDTIGLKNALFSIIELGAWEFAEKKIKEIETTLTGDREYLAMPNLAINCHKMPLKACIECLLTEETRSFDFDSWRIVRHLLELGLKKPSLIPLIAKRLSDCNLTDEQKMMLDEYSIWGHLLEKDWVNAGKLLEKYPVEQLNKDTSILHTLYGCWLQATEGKEIAQIHFAGVMNMTYPRSWSLLSYYLIGELRDDGWFQRAFLWEKRQLYKQLALYYTCTGDTGQAQHFQSLEKDQYLHDSL